MLIESFLIFNFNMSHLYRLKIDFILIQESIIYYSQLLVISLKIYIIYLFKQNHIIIYFILF
jgi:hypothetical protein